MALSISVMTNSWNEITPPSFIAKIFKVPVFRIALGNDLISRILIAVHNFFATRFRAFDPGIAQTSLERFKALGAKADFVTPRDGKGRVQMMSFKAQDLAAKITALGGAWERRSVNSKEVFAIVPPEHPSPEWRDLQEKISHFHWPEENGMIITCDCADVIPDGRPKCFLFAHSTSIAFTSDWKRAASLLGAKQDICFFDNGNTWENREREASEESFDLEIEAVYEKIKNGYALQDFWVGGNCGGAPVAAYLKWRLHRQGINCFIQQSFPDLQDFVSNPIAHYFMPLVKGSVSSRTLPSGMEDRPPACQFGVEKMWADLPQYGGPGGKVILIEVEKDEHISSEAYARYLALARRVNTQVAHIRYQSTAQWHHADDYFNYPEPRRAFMAAVFR